MNAARRFQLVPMGARAPAGAAACDGVVPGASIDLGHWEGNATAPELKADTSTEIALRFARSGGTVDLAVNNQWALKGDLGMTGVLRTAAPVTCSPEQVARALRDLSTTLQR